MKNDFIFGVKRRRNGLEITPLDWVISKEMIIDREDLIKFLKTK